MKWFKPLAALVCAVVICCPVGTVFANSGTLDSGEAEALTYLREFSKLKRDVYDSSAYFCEFTTDDDCSPMFVAMAAKEQQHMNILKELLDHFGIEDPIVSNDLFEYSEGFLDEELGLTTYVGWMIDYPFILKNAAYLEERNIRDLGQAIDETDEPLLINEYGRLMEDDCIHLWKLASTLHEDPFEYEAQYLAADRVSEILVQASELVSDFVINAGLNDPWYDPLTEGQGFTVSVFEDQATVFLTWYTFDTELPGQDETANLGDPGQRWLTAQGTFDGNQAELVVYSSGGGLFDSALPTPELDPIGTILLQFDDCYTGLLTYALPGIDRSGSIPIQRIASENAALCETINPASAGPADTGGDGVEPSSEPCYVSEGDEPGTIKHLFAVWGSSAADVFAVGGAGTILHYDGASWTPMAWGAGFGLEGVWGSSGTDVYAVGGWDGFGLALGVVLHYDGTCWRQVYSTDEYQFTDVWGTAWNDVYATTSRGGGILHYDGTGWTPIEVASGNDAADGANGVWGNDSEDVFVVDANNVWRYGGGDWRLAASVDASVLRRVWGSSSTDVYAVGARYTPAQTLASIWRFDGAAWTFMDSGVEGARWDVWGSSSSNVFVVGDDSGSGLISHYDGSGWNNTHAGITPTLQGVWGSGADNVYVVGGGPRNGSCCTGVGTILHYDGNTWQTVLESGQFK